MQITRKNGKKKRKYEKCQPKGLQDFGNELGVSHAAYIAKLQKRSLESRKVSILLLSVLAARRMEVKKVLIYLNDTSD